MKKYFTFKRVIVYLVVLGLIFAIVYNIFGKQDNPENVLTESVKVQNLKQTVLATGQVSSSTDLGLSFKTSGNVSRVLVKVGDKVKEGAILANLEQRDQVAGLTQARGSLAQARANLDRVLSGASNEEVRVAQKAVDAAEVTLENAKRNLVSVTSQQDVLVGNAYNSLLNSSPEALANPSNISKPTVSVSGSYFGKQDVTYVVTIYQTGNGPRFSVTGPENMDSPIFANSPTPLGTKGLFISFSTTSLYANDSWSITLPNSKASTYTTNLNAYNSALENKKSAIESAQNSINSAQVALDQAKASLDLKRSSARPAEVAAAQAQILSAQGQVQAAESNLENTIIRAPSNGTITTIDIKVGEIASAQKTVIKLQDVENLHVEANISEANIANLKLGQKVEMTLDAFGQDQKFIGEIRNIDPSSTVVSGVVNYKVVAGIDRLDSIKPGMTANMTILVAELPNVLVIPQRAVLTEGSVRVVRVVTDKKTKVFKNVPVTLGLEGDDGLVEVKTGLVSGEEIVTFIKK